jgi:hypothetical protein
MLDAYATADRLREAGRVKPGGASYPGTALADRLRLIARLLQAGFGTRVYYATQGGYDRPALGGAFERLPLFAGARRGA